MTDTTPIQTVVPIPSRSLSVTRGVSVELDLDKKSDEQSWAEHTGVSSPKAVSRSVVGRLAPSPTGRMHLGNICTALIAWLSVRSVGGRLVLRIEDLDDRARSGPWEELMLDDLRWLGLLWDEGPYRQTDRIDYYKDALQTLEKQGLLYPCFCTRAELHAASAPHESDGSVVYSGTCRDLSAAEVHKRSKTRPPALRLRVPRADDIAAQISFTDRLYGEYAENLARECGDIVLRRSDGVFAYQLVVVVDDALMGVTEVVRGCDLLSSTPRQMYLQNLLGYQHSQYAHTPLLVAPDGRRLSKRDHDCDMGALRERFSSAEELLGYIAHALGIAPDTAPRSAENLIEFFNWDAIRACKEHIVVDEKFFS